MALSRRTGARFQASIWPGFVDAMTALLLVLMFVLTIFMIVQFILRETITGQESELNALSSEVAALAEALGLERERTAELEGDIGVLQATLGTAQDRVAALSAQVEEQSAALADARSQITDFEAQVAALISERDGLTTALATARTEIDAQAEAARLAAARREALEALVADLQSETAAQSEALSASEAARLVEAEAARRLRERLQGAQTELTAMTLALEEERRRAEETLTLLAATEEARDDLDLRLAQALLDRQSAESSAVEASEALAQALAELEQVNPVREAVTAELAAALAANIQLEERLTEAEARAALLAAAEGELANVTEQSLEDRRRITLLNQQVAQLRTQLGSLQSLLDAAADADAEANIQLEALGAQLNSALARAAAEERRRRELEEAERRRLEAEAQDLERYRSEFFGTLRDVLGGQQGVRIEGDRFVFSSEVLFPPGSAVLSADGRTEIAQVAAILSQVVDDIPQGIDWVLQVDGHTDNVPLSGGGRFVDNWELSQARALSVVRYFVNSLGFPPDRLSANGFGEYQPVNLADTPAARAQNRRIELKFTGK